MFPEKNIIRNSHPNAVLRAYVFAPTSTVAALACGVAPRFGCGSRAQFHCDERGEQHVVHERRDLREHAERCERGVMRTNAEAPNDSGKRMSPCRLAQESLARGR